MIRRANEQDTERIMDLLCEVLNVHHEGRPDLFKAGATKYTVDELIAIIHDDNRPIFVNTGNDDKVKAYAFCIFKQELNDNILTPIKTLYIDDLCVDEAYRGEHLASELYRYVLDFAGENDCYNVTLNVWALNDNARKFYERMGLKPQKYGMETIL